MKRPRASILSGYIWRIVSCAEVEKGAENEGEFEWIWSGLPASTAHSPLLPAPVSFFFEGDFVAPVGLLEGGTSLCMGKKK